MKKFLKEMFQKMPEKELKQVYESPRGQLRSALFGLLLLPIMAIPIVIIVCNPFKWVDSSPAVQEAAKWVAACACGLLIIGIPSIWFLVIRPLRTGMVSTNRSGSPKLILRSEEPAVFRSHIIFNAVMAIAVNIFLIIGLLNLVKDLQKAKAAAGSKSVPASATSATLK